MTPRVVVAYGGSLDSAAAFAARAARTGVEIVTVTLDLGQGADLEQVRDHARAAGAARAHVVDARRELAADVIRPALVAGAFDVSPHAVAITRPSIAQHLVAVARMEGASAVAHGARGEDRARLERLVGGLAAGLTVHALEDEDVAATVGDVTQHLWARVVTGRSPIDQSRALYARTSAPAALASHPAVVELALDKGVPVAVNGVPLELDALVEVIDTIAGDHGVGRFESAGGGVTSLVEAPAAVVLGSAVRQLAATALPPDLAALRTRMAAAYAALVVDGAWYTRTRAALDAFTAECAAAMTGTVTLELANGNCRVLDSRVTLVVTPAVAYS
jgi:argininosuccinate synthase